MKKLALTFSLPIALLMVVLFSTNTSFAQGQNPIHDGVVLSIDADGSGQVQDLQTGTIYDFDCPEGQICHGPGIDVGDQVKLVLLQAQSVGVSGKPPTKVTIFVPKKAGGPNN